ncbi:hypothetical protein E1B28_013372 [Marasmius oreades]|uniref:SET domain-containing protein n=1 Tax=Marasmius oreades TaxID=181124 RepID=A0A9P7RPQ5_9AGAR|nr:uncharacterized protein E1B28_013372 [Marasmius oreades]KAG7087402.1 hypothetical protein E1B28_013372 [Marasmius oreades]
MPPKPTAENPPEPEQDLPQQMSFFWLVVPLLVALFYAWYLQQNDAMPAVLSKLFRSGEESDLYDLRILTDRTIFDVVDLKGKGKGLIAIRDIKQGELVIQEKPILTAPDGDIAEVLLNPILQNLTSAQTKALLSLSYTHLKTEKDETVNVNAKNLTPRARYLLAEGIITNNAVGINLNGQHSLGVFPRMARLNHACASGYNLAYAWRDDEGELRIYALKDIKEGEELLISYIDSRRPRKERIEKLEKTYGFTCTCPICSLPPEESEKSDELLPQFTLFYTDFAQWYKGSITGKEAIQHIRKIWQLTVDTGYVRERGRWAQEAAYVATVHGDETSARQWLRLAIEWMGIETGIDSVKTTNLQFTLDNLQEHPELASREVMDVGGPIL